MVIAFLFCNTEKLPKVT